MPATASTTSVPPHGGETRGAGHLEMVNITGVRSSHGLLWLHFISIVWYVCPGSLARVCKPLQNPTYPEGQAQKVKYVPLTASEIHAFNQYAKIQFLLHIVLYIQL